VGLNFRSIARLSTAHEHSLTIVAVVISAQAYGRQLKKNALLYHSPFPHEGGKGGVITHKHPP